jgi:hypothetical protein
LSRWASGIFASLILSGLAGCTGIPQEELNAYQEAFVVSRTAGDSLYGEISPIVAKFDGQTDKCAPQPDSFPDCFDPKLVRVDGGRVDPHDVTVRLVALDVIQSYNLALVEVAQGQPGAAVAPRIAELRTAVIELTALAGVSAGPIGSVAGGAAVASLGKLLATLENLRAGAAARESLLSERETIDALIDALIADTTTVYEIYKRGQNDVAVGLARKVGWDDPLVRKEEEKIVLFHDKLTAYVRLLLKTKESLSTLVEATQSGGQGIAGVRSVIVDATEIKKAAAEFWAVANTAL